MLRHSGRCGQSPGPRGHSAPTWVAPARRSRVHPRPPTSSTSSARRPRSGARRPIGRPSRRSRAGFVACRQQVRMVPAREGRPPERRATASGRRAHPRRRTAGGGLRCRPPPGRPSSWTAPAAGPAGPERPAPPGRHGDGAQPREVRIVVQGDEACELLPGEGARGHEPLAERRPGRAPAPGGGRGAAHQRHAPLRRDLGQPLGLQVPGEAPAVEGVARAGPGGRPRRPRRSGPRAPPGTRWRAPTRRSPGPRPAASPPARARPPAAPRGRAGGGREVLQHPPGVDELERPRPAARRW